MLWNLLVDNREWWESNRTLDNTIGDFTLHWKKKKPNVGIGEGQIGKFPSEPLFLPHFLHPDFGETKEHLKMVGPAGPHQNHHPLLPPPPKKKRSNNPNIQNPLYFLLSIFHPLTNHPTQTLTWLWHLTPHFSIQDFPNPNKHQHHLQQLPFLHVFDLLFLHTRSFFLFHFQWRAIMTDSIIWQSWLLLLKALWESNFQSPCPHFNDNARVSPLFSKFSLFLSVWF